MPINIHKNHLIHIFIIIILIGAAYINSINNAFLSDDLGLFDNPKLIGPVSYIFGEPQSIAKTTVNWIIFQIFGSTPAAFRGINIILHTGCSILIYLIILIVTQNPITALLSGILTAIHPILVESVTWISAGNYVQYAFFFLLSLYFYIRSKTSLSQNFRLKTYYFLSVFFFTLSVLTSEKAIVLFLTFILYELSLGNIKKNWKKILPFTLISITWLILFFIVFKFPQIRATNLTSKYYGESGFYNPLIQIPTAISRYFELIFFPINLSFYHSEFIISSLEYFLRILVLFIYLVFLVISFFKFKKIFFFLSLFLISLLPTLTPVKIAWVVAERYAYLGSISVFAVISILFSNLISRLKIKSLAIPMVLIVVLILITRTIMRNSDWSTADSLWIATGKTAPLDPKTHNNLGDYYGRHGNLDKAIEEFSIAIKLQPNYADAYHNRGNTYIQKKNFEKATEDYLMAVKYNPNIWQTHQNLAAIYFESGDYHRSIDYIQKAVNLNPTSPYLLTSLAIVYEKIGNSEKAKALLQEAVNIDPNFRPPPDLINKLK